MLILLVPPFFLIGLAASAILWWAFRPKARWATMVLGLVPFVLAALPLAATVAAFLLPEFIGRLRSPNEHFQEIFGEPPPPRVSDLRASASGGPDFAIAYVAFHAPPDEIASWLHRRGFAPSKSAQDILASSSDSRPAWWPGAPCDDSTTYLRRKIGDWDEVAVLICRTDATVYAMADWVE